MDEPINLKWRGPLKIGSLPETDTTIAALRIGAVYIFFRCYEGGTTLVYVGMAKRKNPFVNRLATHYGDFLSSKVGTLYRGDGSVFREGGLSAYFHSMQHTLDETLTYARADACLTRVIYASLADDQLSTVETAIMVRFKKLLPDHKFIKWNTVPKTYKDLDSPIQSDTSALELELFTPEESDRLLKVILPACHTSTLAAQSATGDRT